ncbi:MAG: hypothetical protein KME50_28260 [Nostoc desertorum CM1-VF14]|nr:hypothetical protein [Nostoc desertorum CM1-VF14]
MCVSVARRRHRRLLRPYEIVQHSTSELEPSTQELEERRCQVTSLINEVDRLREAKKFKEAAIKYKAALQIDPNSLLAHN